MCNMKRLYFSFVANLFLVISLSGCGYNSMVSMREDATAQLAQVENAYQRRYDLIPNLVEVAKEYATHEKGVFVDIADARSRIGQGKIDPAQMTEESLLAYQAAQNSLGGALSRLLVLKEAYPELKANEQFNKLSDELSGTENRIAHERRSFNEKAREYNQYIQQIPQSFYAGSFGFKQIPYFKSDEGAQHAPKVKF